MIEFLQNLWRSGNYGFIQREKEDKRLSYWINLKRDAIAEVWRDPTANYFFGVHPSASIPTHSEGDNPVTMDARFLGARNSLVQCINCLFADVDSTELPDLAFKPSVIISSGNGFHLYWLLLETLHIQDDEDRQVVKTLQRNWAAFVGGDLAAVDLRRTLRPAGSFNLKYTPARLVEFIEYDLSRRYNVADLWQASYVLPRTVAPPVSTTNSGDVMKHLECYLRKTGYDLNDYGQWLSFLAYAKFHHPGTDGLTACEEISARYPKHKPGDVSRRWGGLGNV